MKRHRKFLSISGVLLFSIGILLGLALSGWYVWGEVEAVLLAFRTNDTGTINLRCPLMIASTEVGIVTASFDNQTEEGINPTVRAEISHPNLMRTESTILALAPAETKQLHWRVGPEDTVFGGLVLVNVYETSQRNFPSHQGSCGILVSKIPGLSGKWVFLLIFFAGLFGIATGIILWMIGNAPLKNMIQSATNAGFTLAIIVVAAMLLAFPRWWGLTGFLFFAAIMLIVIIFTQFILFPSETKRGRR